MRIADNMRYTMLSLGNERNSQALMTATQAASSGIAVGEPSDNPVAYAAAVTQDGQIAQVTSRRSAINQATNNLSLADNTLSSAADVLTQVKSVALQMANGDENAGDRATAATTVSQLMSTLVGLANTKGANGYIFAGTNTGTAPFTATGAFTGNDDTVNVEVADNTTVAGNASGAQAFTAAGGQDVFQTLTNLSTAMANNDVTGIQNQLGGLDASYDQVVAARSDVGSTVDRLNTASQVSTNALTTLQTAQASTVDADAITAYSNLSQTQTAYQASMQVTSQILSLPLFAPGQA
jgi:flagellar hook-associated protein 3 FlgL